MNVGEISDYISHVHLNIITLVVELEVILLNVMKYVEHKFAFAT